MTLKTATLIALIGMTVYLCLSVLSPFYVDHLYRISLLLGQAITLFHSILIGGSVVLFLAVFYSKLK